VNRHYASPPHVLKGSEKSDWQINAMPAEIQKCNSAYLTMARSRLAQWMKSWAFEILVNIKKKHAPFLVTGFSLQSVEYFLNPFKPETKSFWSGLYTFSREDSGWNWIPWIGDSLWRMPISSKSPPLWNRHDILLKSASCRMPTTQSTSSTSGSFLLSGRLNEW